MYVSWHANITPFYKRDLSIHEFASAVNPPWIQKENCTLVTKTETIVETASGFWGGIIKNSILDKVRSLKDINVDFSRYLEIASEMRKEGSPNMWKLLRSQTILKISWTQFLRKQHILFFIHVLKPVMIPQAYNFWYSCKLEVMEMESTNEQMGKN